MTATIAPAPRRAPALAELPLTVLLVTVSVPMALTRPPPPQSAVFPLMVLFCTVAVPPTLNILPAWS